MSVAGKIVVGLLIISAAGPSRAVVRIANDRGGQIGEYVERYEKLRESRQSVVIDGLCASACTIVLATISPDNICVTSRRGWPFMLLGICERMAAPLLIKARHESFIQCIRRQFGVGLMIGEG